MQITVPNITRTWAPEFFSDPCTKKLHIIVSLGVTTSNFHPYLFTATDDTLLNWSAPELIQGFNPNFIDTFIVSDEEGEGPRYHAFTKNENTKWVEHAVADRLTGPYTFVQTGEWLFFGNYSYRHD